MVDITWRDWFEIPPSLLLPPPFSLAVPAAVDAFCELYRAFPDEVDVAVSNIPGSGSGTGSYLLPRLCPPPPGQNPPVAVPPFEGGQCCGSYDVTVVATIEGVTSTLIYENVPGRIRGLRYTPGEAVPNTFTGNWTLIVGGDCPGVQVDELFVVGGTNMSTRPSAAITAIALVSGGADDCGNPAPSYPPQSPTPDDFEIDIDIEIGGDNYNYPIEILPPNPSPDYPYRPEINIQVGDDFIINITGEGFNIGFPATNPNNPQPDRPDPRPEDRIPPPVAPPPLFPPFPEPGSGGGGDPGNGNCPDVNLRPVLDAIARLDADVDIIGDNVELLLDCDRCSPPTPEECVKRLIGTGQGARFQLGDRVAWVGVEVTTKPSNSKGYFAVDSPDVVFAGWHTFGSTTAEGVRTPIQYDLNIYPVVAKATSFSFGLQTGYQANYYVYEVPEDS